MPNTCPCCSYHPLSDAERICPSCGVALADEYSRWKAQPQVALGTEGVGVSAPAGLEAKRSNAALPQATLHNQMAIANADIVRQSDLFFGSIVASYLTPQNPRFLRRDWLASEVDAKLRDPADPDCRFVLLTAEPGAGKSAFIAQLASDHPDWLVYFIRSNQMAPLDVGAHSFLLQVGYQLAVLHPELFEPKQIQIAVEQRLGTSEAIAEVVGAEIKRLLASPFYRHVIRIQQTITTNRGSLTGLRIDELNIEPRLLPLEDLQYMALLDPARVLLKNHRSQQIVILIDALDELRYHPGGETIMDWLGGLTTQLPGNIRFVLTSRSPDEALVTFIEQHNSQLRCLMIEPQDQRITQDLRTYTQQLIAMPEVAPLLVVRKQGAQGFVTEAVAKAAGNIGYLDALARGIDQALTLPEHQGLRELLTLEQLPDGTRGLYAFFFHQIATLIRDRCISFEDPTSGEQHWLKLWPDVCLRVLGLLSVARAPLSVNQIKQLGSILPEREYVVEAVSWLRQFLDEVSGGYRFYHPTVHEFLGSDKTRDNPEWQDLYAQPERWHRQIATYYRKQGWHCEDTYGVQYLVSSHLRSMEHRSGTEFTISKFLVGSEKLFSRSYFNRKRELMGSEQPFLQDVQLLLPLVDHRTAVAICRQIIYELPPNSYRQITLLNDIATKALKNANLRRQFSKNTSVLASVICTLAGEPPEELVSKLSSTGKPQDKLVEALCMQLQLLKGSQQRDRVVIYLALGLSGNAAAEPTLLAALREVREHLSHTDEKYTEAWYKVGWAAAEGLRALGRQGCSTATLSTLRTMLQGSDTRERTLALYVLSRGGFFEPSPDHGYAPDDSDKGLIKQAIQQALNPIGKHSWRFCAIAADTLPLFWHAFPEAITRTEAVSLLRDFLKAQFYLRKDNPRIATQRAHALKRVIAALGEIGLRDKELENELLSYRSKCERIIPVSSEEKTTRTALRVALDEAIYATQSGTPSDSLLPTQ